MPTISITKIEIKAAIKMKGQVKKIAIHIKSVFLLMVSSSLLFKSNVLRSESWNFVAEAAGDEWLLSSDLKSFNFDEDEIFFY